MSVKAIDMAAAFPFDDRPLTSEAKLAVSAVLRGILRHLRDPVIPLAMQERFIDVQSREDAFEVITPLQAGSSRSKLLTTVRFCD